MHFVMQIANRAFYTSIGFKDHDTSHNDLQQKSLLRHKQWNVSIIKAKLESFQKSLLSWEIFLLKIGMDGIMV